MSRYMIAMRMYNKETHVLTYSLPRVLFLVTVQLELCYVVTEKSFMVFHQAVSNLDDQFCSFLKPKKWHYTLQIHFVVIFKF